jgi:hypothetical protein
MSLIDSLSFDDRTLKMGKSSESHVLIVNFSESTVIVLNYVLTTPVEITVFEYHPENPNVIIGGGMNGQIVVWDVASPEHRINEGKKASG